MPPTTEVAVQIAAYSQARCGRASDIGISITSGGTGKNELSANDTAPMIHSAYGLCAASRHQFKMPRTTAGWTTPGRICPCRESREIRGVSVALAQAAAPERDNWPPGDPGWRNLRHL